MIVAALILYSCNNEDKKLMKKDKKGKTSYYTKISINY